MTREFELLACNFVCKMPKRNDEMADGGSKIQEIQDGINEALKMRY